MFLKPNFLDAWMIDIYTCNWKVTKILMLLSLICDCFVHLAIKKFMEFYMASVGNLVGYVAEHVVC